MSSYPSDHSKAEYLCADPRLTVEEHASAKRAASESSVGQRYFCDAPMAGPGSGTVEFKYTADELREAADAGRGVQDAVSSIYEQQMAATQREMERAVLGRASGDTEATRSHADYIRERVRDVWLNSYKAANPYVGDAAPLQARGYPVVPLPVNHVVGRCLNDAPRGGLVAVEVGGARTRTIHNTGIGPMTVIGDGGQGVTLLTGESITLESDTRPDLVKRDFQARLYLALEDWWDRRDLAECNVLELAEGIADDMCVKDWDGVALRPGPAGWVDVFWNGYHCGAVDLVGTRDEVQRRHGYVSARAVAAASVASAKAVADEQEALRRELATPPRGYSVDVWHAFIAMNSECTVTHKPIEFTSAMLVDLRAMLDSGFRIPERIVTNATPAAGPKPLHAYRYGSGR